MTPCIAVAAAARASLTLARWTTTPTWRSATSGTSVTVPVPPTLIVRSGVVSSTARAERGASAGPRTTASDEAADEAEGDPSGARTGGREGARGGHGGDSCWSVRRSGRRAMRLEGRGSGIWPIWPPDALPRAAVPGAPRSRSAPRRRRGPQAASVVAWPGPVPPRFPPTGQPLQPSSGSGFSGSIPSAAIASATASAGRSPGLLQRRERRHRHVRGVDLEAARAAPRACRCARSPRCRGRRSRRAASGRGGPATPSPSRRRATTGPPSAPRTWVTYGTRGCCGRVQPVPALHLERVAAQQLPGGRAVHARRPRRTAPPGARGRRAPAGGSTPEATSRTRPLRPALDLGRRQEAVEAPHDPLVHALGLRRHGVVLVVERDVVEGGPRRARTSARCPSRTIVASS